MSNKIQKILNTTDYSRFVELLHLFDENNQCWMLNFLHDVLDDPNIHAKWNVYKNEPNEYIAISEEIFDIIEGFICTAHRLDGQTVWDVYGLKRINQK